MQFDQTTYTVNEEEFIATVCLSADPDVLQRNVSVTLTTSENSAEGLCLLSSLPL